MSAIRGIRTGALALVGAAWMVFAAQAQVPRDPVEDFVNVYFDGVSGTDIQRAEFGAFLRHGGAAALVEKLEELVAAQGP